MFTILHTALSVFIPFTSVLQYPLPQFVLFLFCTPNVIIIILFVLCHVFLKMHTNSSNV